MRRKASVAAGRRSTRQKSPPMTLKMKVTQCGCSGCGRMSVCDFVML